MGEGVVSTMVIFSFPGIFISGRRWALRKAVSDGVCGPEVSGREALEPLLEDEVDRRESEEELRKVWGHTGADGAVWLRRVEDRDGRGADTRRLSLVSHEHSSWRDGKPNSIASSNLDGDAR